MISLSSIWSWVRDNYALVIMLLELLVGVVGFGIAIYELRKTKSAVEASKQAAQQTLQAMSDRLTISDIALIQASLREIQVALRGNRWESALLRIQATRTSLQQLKRRAGFTSDVRQIEIQKMVVSLAKLQARMEKNILVSDGSLSIVAANNMLSGFIDCLSEWGEEMRFTQRGEINDLRRS